MKKALVTGAAGFIGSHVVRELLTENIEVRAMVRPGEPLGNLSGLEIEIVHGDILDQGAVTAAVSGVDIIFHLAAVYSIWMKDWRTIYEVNLQGSRNVLWAARKADTSKVVYTSSIAAIGTSPGKQLSDETTPFNQYGLGSHYVLTKYLSQQEALGFAQNGMDLVVVNPCFPFGENDIAPTPTGKSILDVISGLARFQYKGGINIVDVTDVARGHILAAQKGKTGELYILGNQNVTMEKFIRTVNRIAGFPNRKLLKLPVPVLKAGTSVLKLWSDVVSHKPPLSTPAEIHYTSQYLFFDITKAKTELGLTLSPIEASIEKSIQWFRKNGYLFK